METIDIVFVVSLSILALSMVIFLIFFIPVLIQLAKVLEAVQSLTTLAKDYVHGINNRFFGVSDNLGKVADYLGSIAGAVGEGVMDLVFSGSKRK